MKMKLMFAQKKTNHNFILVIVLALVLFACMHYIRILKRSVLKSVTNDISQITTDVNKVQFIPYNASNDMFLRHVIYRHKQRRYKINNKRKKYRNILRRIGRKFHLIKTGYPVVPNYVHYLRINEPEFSLINAICLLSVYKNHIPSKIFIHSYNSTLSGIYWEKIQQTKGLRLLIQVVNVSVSKKFFNDFDSHQVHSILQLNILASYGGIFLDKDMFVGGNMDSFLEYEMTLHWKGAQHLISNKILIARKNARFLRLWIKRYKVHIKKFKKPLTCMEFASFNIIKRNISLVRIERSRFIINPKVLTYIYDQILVGWRKKNVIWLMENHIRQKIKRKITQYVNNGSAKKTNRENHSDAHEKPTIFQMIDDVY